jgi:DNA-binding NtrC family response regulator
MTIDCVLIVEDEPVQQKMLQLLCKKIGFATRMAGHGREAVEQVQASTLGEIGVVLLDISMPQMDGFETLGWLRKYRPDLPVVMLTSHDDTALAVRAIKEGASDFIAKPAEPAQLEVALRNALRLGALTRELARLKRDREGALAFVDLVGHERGLAEAVALGRKAAAADVPVFITGETGTGKELFARAIHGESKRVGAPFVALNCGAIPENLVESTLFGHEKGAFTGAVARSIGKFREAEGGTIFLDEVGELPLDAQVKLLRVLQQKEVEPVGAGKAVKVNVRIISATHRDLRAEVKAGRFREDLFFRLHVLPVALPPLRARKEDIVPLAQSFMQRLGAAEGLAHRSLSGEAQAYLLGCRWPGNVRELENLIHRALVLGEAEVIDRATLTALHELEQGADSADAPQSATQSHGLTLALMQPDGQFKPMQQLEQDAMQAALAHFGGNITRAAEALGIAKSTFYRKIRESTV